MKLAIEKSTGFVLYCGDLKFADGILQGDGFIVPLLTEENCEIIEVDFLPFEFIGGGGIKYENGPLLLTEYGQQQLAQRNLPPVPQQLTARQARLALLNAGLLDDVEAAVIGMSRAAQIEWEYATDIERTHTLISEAQAALGLSDEQIDSLFKAGGLLVSTWRYKLDAPFEMMAPELIGISFQNEWVTIRHGRVRIVAGYAWDGCSPAWCLPGGIWIGTPDGPLGIDGRPVTWAASLVHDALCQFRPDIPGLRKSATVALFRRMLQECGAPWWMAQLYPRAVERFGPQNWNGGD